MHRIGYQFDICSDHVGYFTPVEPLACASPHIPTLVENVGSERAIGPKSHLILVIFSIWDAKRQSVGTESQ
jgi:hypothetical protein